ncbi:MAG: hypothetical protein M0002_19910 [Rhodospirillales bacterium]|nr:hypothetical protein [Rhodospirillales bacterium]
MKGQGSVLVLGDDTRSFLAIVRSLGRGGVEVHAVPGDFASPALASRYLSAAHRLPPYLGGGEEWCQEVAALLRSRSFDLVVPCDERTILPFDRHRGRFAGLTRLALPDPPALAVLFDKEKTRELATSCGVPVAPGRRITPEDRAANLIAEFGLPLVLKPARSFRLEALHTRARVEIYEHEAGLAAALFAVGEVATLAESYFAGRGAGISILASRGRVLQAFQHSRARERGGAGFYRVSRPLAPDLLGAVERMTAAVAFTGVAMFEFKIAPGSGQWILLEVNARPWGSMPLAVALGVDFPLRWYRLLVAGEETPPVAYPAGIYGRNLMPDARQILAEARERRSSPIAMIRHLAAAGSEFGRLLVGREHLDVLVADDPRPGISEIRREAKGAASRLLRRLPGSRLLLGWRDREKVKKLARRWRGGRATVVMLCQGNICRSPVAAELLRRRLAGRMPGIAIVAAGMLPREGACSPQPAIAAAEGLGVDLSKHRSLYFSERLAAEANLAVVFDQRNRVDLLARYPGLLDRTVMLGSFLDGRSGPREIADPDGGDLATFERTYAVIATAVKSLAAAIEEGQRT